MANPKQAHIADASFTTELEKRYLSYALSTITARSLPDTRDGLKPVHRRLLYAMLQLQLNPGKGFKKCARVVGDVIGKYHPHGDGAVYDALVRMAQTFAVRYPLIEGQGNFGSIDGDGQAAMRYTEARLTPYAMLLLGGLYENAVDFRDNYDASESEPVVLPASVPNILANGCEGIAVGMATSIPPHNLLEICKAILHLLKHPHSSSVELMRYIPAPDFPTGGIIIQDDAALRQIYETGRGTLRLRARWHQEDLSHSQYQLIITEIPYQTQKRAIIERMAELYHDKKLPLLDSFQDMSSDDIRIIITPRNRAVDPNLLMESLFKLTELETKIHVNMNALDSAGIPRVMSLPEILTEFLAHRRIFETRILTYKKQKVLERLEVLDGLLIVYSHLDEIIRILREEDDPSTIMVNRWHLTERQVEAILNMRLRSIRKLEENTLRQEHDELSMRKQELSILLEDKTKLDNHIAINLKDIMHSFTKEAVAKRRTTIQPLADLPAVSIEESESSDPVTVFYSERGWLRITNGHQIEGRRYKPGDSQRTAFTAYTTDKIICISNYGKAYTLQISKLNCAKGMGEPLRLLLELQPDEEILTLNRHDDATQFLFIARNGKGFITEASELLAYTKHGKQVMKCAPKELSFCAQVIGDMVALLGENRRLLVLHVNEIPTMSRGQGVALQKYRMGCLASARMFKQEEGLTWQDSQGKDCTLTHLKLWVGKRGGEGRVVLDRTWLD